MRESAFGGSFELELPSAVPGMFRYGLPENMPKFEPCRGTFSFAAEEPSSLIILACLLSLVVFITIDTPF